MADGGKVTLAFEDEGTWGTTDAAALVKVAYATSENFGMDTSTVLANTIRGDYIRPQVIRTDAVGTGGFNFELAYGDTDVFMSHALRAAWGAAVTTTAIAIAAVNADNTYTNAAANFVSLGFAVGDSVLVSGFTNAANNGYAVITALTTTVMTVNGLDLVDEGAGGDEIIKHSGVLKNGSTLKSMTIERHFSDLTNTYISQKGYRVSGYNLSAAAGSIITGSVAGTSKAPTAVAAATAGSGAYSNSPGDGNEIMNGVDHVSGIFVANDDTLVQTAVSYCVSQIDLNIGSPVRPISCLGTLGPAAIGGSSFEITGSMRVYTDDSSKGLWDDYINYQEKALWFRFVDTAGNAYLFYLPQINITGMSGPNSEGPDSDVMQTIEFTAELDATSSALMTITRIAAA